MPFRTHRDTPAHPWLVVTLAGNRPEKVGQWAPGPCVERELVTVVGNRSEKGGQ